MVGLHRYAFMCHHSQRMARRGELLLHRGAEIIKRTAEAVAAFGAAPPDPPISRIGPLLTSSATRADAFYSPVMAERVGTANRCLQLVSQQIAAMPLRFRGTFEPMWISNPDPVWFPNGIGDVMFAATWSIYSWGDAFLWVTGRYETGWPRSFTLLNPATVTVEAKDGGRKYTVNSGGLVLEADDVIQISRDPKGGLRGTGALSAYAGNLMAAAEAERYAGDVYAGGGVPWAVLQPQRRLTAEQAADLQSQWVTRVGSRQAAPAVIPPDITFTPFSLSPADLMLLESREWDAKQIAAAFGVPAFMLNMEQAGGLNYSNPEMLFTTWWRTELYPSARKVEAALSTWLPRGNWVEFDPSILLRPDLKTHSEVWLSLSAAGIVTPDEVRAAVLDLPPLTEGEAIEMIDEPAGADTSAIEEAPAPPPELKAVL